MEFNITIQGPAGNLSTFTKDYPTLFIAQTLTEADMELCNAVFAEAYQGREGRIVSITVSELDDSSVLGAETVE